MHRTKNRTHYGLVYTNDNRCGAYGITEEPVCGVEVPEWLKGWRFETEFIALFTLNLFGMLYLKSDRDDRKVDPDELRFVLKGALKLAGVESAWAK